MEELYAGREAVPYILAVYGASVTEDEARKCVQQLSIGGPGWGSSNNIPLPALAVGVGEDGGGWGVDRVDPRSGDAH